MNSSLLQKLIIVVVGEKSIGKTSLIRRYIENFFNEQEIVTIGADYYKKIVNDKIQLDIWDTSGGERYLPITINYCNNADIILYVHCVSESYDIFQNWLTATRYTLMPKKKKIYVIISKMDNYNSNYDESLKKIKKKCSELKISIFQISSKKDSSEIVNMFNYIVTNNIL